jgi:hypothetical protein
MQMPTSTNSTSTDLSLRVLKSSLRHHLSTQPTCALEYHRRNAYLTGSTMLAVWVMVGIAITGVLTTPPTLGSTLATTRYVVLFSTILLGQNTTPIWLPLRPNVSFSAVHCTPISMKQIVSGLTNHTTLKLNG